MSKKYFTAILLLLLCAYSCTAQAGKENRPPDTRPELSWWNLLHYSIAIIPDYNKKFIKGSNSIHFRALQTAKVMQINLQQPMHITSVTWHNTELKFTKNDEAYFITFPQNIEKGKTETITIYFQGKPKEAIHPPWDSGWIWATDIKGRPWMSIACEGSGAAIWLPCKSVLYDEPDNGISFSITVPDTLVAVANGRLDKKINNKNGTATYTWKVLNPINNYNIIPCIGKYVTWHRNYPGIKGDLDCDYWVLDYNLEKAKKHLMQADTVLRCFEYWLGPYPFYEDSYKVVEAPMAGMEHQSAIAYGNGFENGYSGKNLSGTNWGLKWDFILVHESGHEWFGNSLTASNNGESWIHEGFTKYLETLYTEYLSGKEAGNDYTLGIWKRILNDEPILRSGSSDQYNKGSAMLHTIRQIIGDTIFRDFLRGLNKTFYHETISTEQILHTLDQITGKDFTKVFDQYLGTTMVPKLEYTFVSDTVFQYRWSNCVPGFDMPVKISLDSKKDFFIYPTTQWQELPVSGSTSKNLVVDRNFYIKI
ncbi:MAG: M1 family metallopeptidase [Bacteroidota bacterium]